MASLPKRSCAQPGCPNLVESGRCPTHQRKWNRDRGSSTARGYGSDWQRLRAIKLNTDPFCQIMTHCNGAMPTEVDHIIPIEQRPDLRLVWSNLQSTCDPCHNAKTRRDNGIDGR